MITIKVQPDLLQTGYNEHILVLDSDKKTEAKFQFVIDVEINGVTKSRIKQSVNPDGYGVIDLHKHLTPYISYDIDITDGSTFRRIPNSYTKYNVSLSEEYVFEWDFDDNNLVIGVPYVGFVSSTIDHPFSTGDRVLVTQDPGYTNEEYNGIHTILSTPTTKQLVIDVLNGVSTPAEPGIINYADNRVTIFAATASLTTDKYYFNGVLDFTEVTSWNEATYTLGTASPGQFLTKNPNTMNVELDDRIQMNIYNSATGVATYMYVTTQNGTFRITNTFTINQHTNKFISCYVGPYDLLNTTSIVSVISGSLPMFDSSSTSYTVHLTDNTSTITSETKTFNFIAPCSIYEKFKLMFMDRFGAFSSVSFNMKNRSKGSVKRDTYQKNHGTYNSSTNTWGYNNWDRGDVVYNQMVTDTISVSSDWVNEDQGQLITEMLQSPEVYHVDEAGNLLAVNVQTSSFERKKLVNDMIFNYDISFQYSYTNNQQRG